MTEEELYGLLPLIARSSPSVGLQAKQVNAAQDATRSAFDPTIAAMVEILFGPSLATTQTTYEPWTPMLNDYMGAEGFDGAVAKSIADGMTPGEIARQMGTDPDLANNEEERRRLDQLAKDLYKEKIDDLGRERDHRQKSVEGVEGVMQKAGMARGGYKASQMPSQNSKATQGMQTRLDAMVKQLADAEAAAEAAAAKPAAEAPPKKPWYLQLDDAIEGGLMGIGEKMERMDPFSGLNSREDVADLLAMPMFPGAVRIAKRLGKANQPSPQGAAGEDSETRNRRLVGDIERLAGNIQNQDQLERNLQAFHLAKQGRTPGGDQLKRNMQVLRLMGAQV